MKSSPIKLLVPIAAAASVVVIAIALHEPAAPPPCPTEPETATTPITKIPSTYVKPGDLQKPPPAPPAPERPHPPLAR